MFSAYETPRMTAEQAVEALRHAAADEEGAVLAIASARRTALELIREIKRHCHGQGQIAADAGVALEHLRKELR